MMATMPSIVPFNDIHAQHLSIQGEIDAAAGFSGAHE
jgi:hypothetical protein